MDEAADTWDAAKKRLAKRRDFDAHWKRFQKTFEGRDPAMGPPPAWRPDAKTIAASNLTWLSQHVGVAPNGLHAWSVQAREAFWSQMLERLHVPFASMPTRILDPDSGLEDPDWLPGARLNIAAACWNADPGKTAIIAGGEGQETRTWTYGELHALADRVSHGLGAMQLAAGDAVALYMPMTPECVAAYLGIVQAGMAVVSIPDSFAPDEVATRLRLGGAKAVVTVHDFARGGKRVPMYPKARDAAQEYGARCIVIGDGDVEAGDLAWHAFLGPARPFEPVPCGPQDVSNVLFSSGTTGEPKAIPWTHLTPIKCAVDGHLHQDIHPDDVVAWPTNIGWMMGPWLIYASLVNQATMALYEGVPTGAGFLAFLREARVSMLGVVPAIVRAWKANGDAAPGDLPHVRIFSSTGEASNPQDFLYLMSLADYRAPIIEYCGGTEIGGGHLTNTVLTPCSPATFTSPAMGLDFVVLDEEGAPVPPGGHGEIFIVGPSIGLSQRLLNRDHHAEYYAGCPPGPRGEVLRRHGDEVHVLWGAWAAGGRADDTMNLGGIKVSSIELENAMNGHPAVLETAAVAIRPDEGGADRLVVFAVLEEDRDDLQAQLQARIKKRLNPLFRIHDLVVVESLPRTASNKVMRRKLRAQYAVA